MSADEAYTRIVSVSGLRPDTDLESSAQAVLRWLAQQDETVVDALVSVLGAVRQNERERAERRRSLPAAAVAPRYGRRPPGQFGDPGNSGP
jgi:hypothetical protein